MPAHHFVYVWKLAGADPGVGAGAPTFDRRRAYADSLSHRRRAYAHWWLWLLGG